MGARPLQPRHDPDRRPGDDHDRRAADRAGCIDQHRHRRRDKPEANTANNRATRRRSSEGRSAAGRHVPDAHRSATHALGRPEGRRAGSSSPTGIGCPRRPHPGQRARPDQGRDDRRSRPGRDHRAAPARRNRRDPDDEPAQRCSTRRIGVVGVFLPPSGHGLASSPASRSRFSPPGEARAEAARASVPAAGSHQLGAGRCAGAADTDGARGWPCSPSSATTSGRASCSHSASGATRQGQPAWYRISLPGRPNGRTGWVPAASVELKPIRKEIVIDRQRADARAAERRPARASHPCRRRRVRDGDAARPLLRDGQVPADRARSSARSPSRRAPTPS